MTKYCNEIYDLESIKDRIEETVRYCLDYRLNLLINGKISYDEIYGDNVDFNRLALYIYGLLPREKAFKPYGNKD
jgi:hypothetical protein